MPRQIRPSKLLPPEQLEVLVRTFVTQNRGLGVGDFFERFDLVFAEVDQLFNEEVKGEERAGLVAGWCAYKLGLWPAEYVHPDLLRALS